MATTEPLATAASGASTRANEPRKKCQRPMNICLVCIACHATPKFPVVARPHRRHDHEYYDLGESITAPLEITDRADARDETRPSQVGSPSGKSSLLEQPTWLDPSSLQGQVLIMMIDMIRLKLRHSPCRVRQTVLTPGVLAPSLELAKFR